MNYRERDIGVASLSPGFPDASRPLRSLPQIPALTGLRFFAAFFILFAHSADWLAQFQDSDIRTRLSVVSIYGMPLFFVLSGFVIHYNYRRLFMSRSVVQATCEFAAARFARLFPLYFFFLAIAVVADNFFGKVQNQGGLWVKIVAYYLTLTQSWWYIIYDNKTIHNFMFGLAWSISTEMFFYAAFVAAVFAILTIRTPRQSIVASIGYAVVVFLSLLIVRYFMPTLMGYAETHVPDYIGIDRFNDSFFRWLFYFSPYVRVLEFFLGCFAAHVVILHIDRPVSAKERRMADVALALALVLLALSGLAFLDLLGPPAVHQYVFFLALNFLCAPSIGFILLYVARYDGALTRFMALPALVMLGELSYSIYLVHSWTLRLFMRQPPPKLDWLWGTEAAYRMLCGIVFTLVVSYATYRLIEAPSRAWLRRRLGNLIAVGFYDKSQAPGIDPRKETQRQPVSSLRMRIAFSLGVAAFLVFVAGAGQAARSYSFANQVHRLWYGDRPEISVVSATYGFNCRDVPSAFPKWTSRGNVTAAVKQTCDGRQHCAFLIDIGRIGDPANGCGKDFSVEYTCAPKTQIMEGLVPPVADQKTVDLVCDANK